MYNNQQSRLYQDVKVTLKEQKKPYPWLKSL